MRHYRDDPQFYKDLFVKLVDSLKDRSVFTPEQAKTFIDLMIGDGGPGVPFESLTNRAYLDEIQFTKSELSIAEILNEVIDADSYSDMLSVQQKKL